MKGQFLLFITLSFTLFATAQYTVGKQTVTYTDPARSNRSVGLDMHYPGTNSTVATGQFPFVIFAHGFLMDATPYYPYADSLAKRGYIVGLLTTETGIPSHPDFAQDLVFAYGKLISEGNSNSGSPFYHKVKPKGALGGHSIGGGSTVLSCSYANPAECYFTLAAATTTPSSISAASLMTKPYLSFAGSSDCIAPIATNQQPMYDTSASPCKFLINITNALHCQFGLGNAACDFGEGASGCTTSVLTRTAQINKTLLYLVPYLDYYLKGDCSAWTLFESLYASNVAVDQLQRNCTIAIPSNPSISGTLNFCQGNSTTLTANPTGFQYVWSDNSTGGTLNANTGGTYSVVVGNGTCSLSSVSVSVTENYPPSAPTTITASDTVCSGIANIFISVPSVALATGYNWTLPTGWNITSGNNTNVIQTTSGTGSGTISVTAQNNCGTTAAATKPVTVLPSSLSAPDSVTGTISVCAGQSQVYSVPAVSGASSYLWSYPSGWSVTSGNNTEAITVTTGSNGGLIFVQAVNSCGNSAATGKTINITSAPATPSAIVASDTVCTNIANINILVTNDPSATTYNWILPGGWNVTAGNNTHAIQITSGSSSGTISVTAQNNCGTSSPVSKQITVVPSNLGAPGSILGATAVCAGVSQNYSIAAVSGATSYLWSYPAGWSVTSGNNTEAVTLTTGNAGGLVFVQAVNSCGNSTPTGTNVSIKPIPDIGSPVSGNDSVCMNNHSVLTFSVPAVAAADSFIWSATNNWNISSGQGSNSIGVTPNSSNSTISVHATNNCGTGSSQSINVTVLDTPQVTISQQGNQLSTTLTGVTYQWYLNGTVLSNETNSSITPVQTGNYYLQITDANGCSGTSQSLNVIINSITELDENIFNMFPNPNSTDVLNFTIGVEMLGSELKIVDATGRMAFKSEMTNRKTGINISTLSRGVYVVNVELNGSAIRKKLIIQ